MRRPNDDSEVDIRVERKGYARYWTMFAGQLRHGASLPELFAQLPEPPPLDVGRLHAMAAGQGGIWLTPYAGVERLTFGHRLTWVSGEPPLIERWFTPEDEPLAQAGAGIDRMRLAIRAAISEELGSEDDCTVAMSGGLDSPTVAAIAAQVLREEGGGAGPAGVLALCASPQQGTPATGAAKVADDWPAARAVGDRIEGLDVRRLTNGGQIGPIDVAEEFHRRWAMPLSAPANAWWLGGVESVASREARRVILTGGSGNATFSVGPPGAPGRLLPDGSREAPSGRSSLLGRTDRARGAGRPGWPDGVSRRVRGALRGRGATLPSPLRAGPAAKMPDHVLAMSPYLRWCLAEAMSPAVGPWTGADVRWADPLGAPQVIRAAFAMPAPEWTADGLDRSVARRMTKGLLPDQVRLRRAKGEQSADLPDLLRRHADRYTDALDSFRGSPTTGKILDTDVMWQSRHLLRGSRADALAWRLNYLRPFTVGLFTAWWDRTR